MLFTNVSYLIHKDGCFQPSFFMLIDFFGGNLIEKNQFFRINFLEKFLCFCR